MSRISSSLLILDIANQKRLFTHLLSSPHTYPTTLKEFLTLCQKHELKLKKMIPLKVSLPIWLNLIPQKLALKCYPFLYQLDLTLAKIIPPSRYLVKLSH